MIFYRASTPVLNLKNQQVQPEKEEKKATEIREAGVTYSIVEYIVILIAYKIFYFFNNSRSDLSYQNMTNSSFILLNDLLIVSFTIIGLNGC